MKPADMGKLVGKISRETGNGKREFGKRLSQVVGTVSKRAAEGILDAVVKPSQRVSRAESWILHTLEWSR